MRPAGRGLLLGALGALGAVAISRGVARLALRPPQTHDGSEWPWIPFAIALAALLLAGVLLAFALRRLHAKDAPPPLGAVVGGAVALLVGLTVVPLRSIPTLHGLPVLPPGQALDGPPGSGLQYSVNAAGFRGPGALPSAPSTGRRLAVVGDSFVFGIGVPDEATLTAALGRRVNAEILNLGVPGANLETHVHAAAVACGELDADAPLFVITGANDFATWDVRVEAQQLARPSALRLAAVFLGERRAREAAWLFAFDPGPRAPGPPERARLATALSEVAALGCPTAVLAWRLAQTPEIEAALRVPGLRLVREPEWDEDTDYLRDGHPSALGHARAAAALQEPLADLLLERRDAG